MSPRQLLEKLEQLGNIEPKILGKIRAQIDDPDKVVKPKAVLRYLVKKNQISKQDAKQLLESKPAPDEIVVNQPVEKDFDTDDLTGIVAEPETPATPPPKTDEPVEPIIEVEPSSIEEPETAVPIEPEPIESVEAIEIGSEAVVAESDPLGDALLNPVVDPGHTDTEYASETETKKTNSSLAFLGKRNQRNQWDTKWLYIGFGILGVLIIGTAVLSIFQFGQRPEEMFKAAMNSFNKQTWADATKKFDEFLDQFPNHANSKTAEVRRVHSIIRGTAALQRWEETIQQAETLLPTLIQDDEVNMDDELRQDLAVVLPPALIEISGEATDSSDIAMMESDLGVILEYKKIIDNPIYITTSSRKIPTVAKDLAKIENNIKTLQGQIDKEKQYLAALSEIRNLREEAKTVEAFAIYQKLVRNYGDLPSRAELRELMLTISEKERDLIEDISLDLPLTDSEATSPIKRSVIMAVTTGDPVESLKQEIISFLADGSVYGIDAGTGAIAWRRFVGYQTNIHPILLDGEVVLVSDQRQQQLMAVDKKTGSIVWRTEIGEPFMTPSVSDNALVVTTASGKIIQLSAISGKTEHSIKLPLPANTNSLPAPRDPYIYQTGAHSNLYVIDRQDFSCKEVFYLGHYRGSITSPPIYWSGYILVSVNRGDQSDLMVLKPTSNGLGLKLIQVINEVTDGPLSQPIHRFSRWALLVADNGHMKILELDPTSENSPVQTYSQDRFDTKGSSQTFLTTEGSNLWIAGQGITRYRIRRADGSFNREVITKSADAFISPIRKLDDYIVHVRRRGDSGMLSASAVDAKTLTQIWRTDFGGALAGPPIQFDNQVVTVSNQGDVFKIDQTAQENGYADNAVRASDIIENLQFQNLLQLPDQTFACIAPVGRSDFLFSKSPDSKTNLIRLGQPSSNHMGRPLVIGNKIVLAASSGQIARINPATGQLAGTPFQPPIQPGTTTPWVGPTKISDTTFAVAAGSANGQQSSKFYLVDASDENTLQPIGMLESPASFKSDLANDGELAFGVIGPEIPQSDADSQQPVANGGDRLVSISLGQRPAIKQNSDLPGSAIGGPWLCGDLIVVRLDNDKLYGFDKQLSQQWSLEVSPGVFATPPELFDDQIRLCFENGTFVFLDPANGQPVKTLDIGQPIVHRPLRIGDTMYLSGRDGTVHIVDLENTTTNLSARQSN